LEQYADTLLTASFLDEVFGSQLHSDTRPDELLVMQWCPEVDLNVNSERRQILSCTQRRRRNDVFHASRIPGETGLIHA
jgi:hypothetical protein